MVGPQTPNNQGELMPEIIFNGPEGRLEGRYFHSKTENAPIVLLLHPHPQGGGTMNNKVVYNLFNAFTQLGFSALRFNFRGVGRSQGRFDNGIGELADAAAALDWVQSHNADAAGCWIAGFSFGAWIGMQLLMRRPEIEGFISVAPPANLYDFTFLAPCPTSGLIVHGDNDELVPLDSVKTLGTKLSSQRDITVKHVTISGANHFFQNKLEEMTSAVSEYVDQARKESEAVSEAS
ncbi:MAG: alpha/beta superfamily hydrolase [Alphaproteobacteria bacterium]|jgi:alpha/beta superfamily hydrolase